MKYLYVLVSNSADYYSEQAFLSIYSLKQKTPNAFVSLLVDNQTAEYLENDFKELIKSVNEFKIVDLDSKYSNKEKSRILKTTMRQHIDGDFLFIDCDTVICEDLSEIEKCEYDIGCVLDTHVTMDKHSYKQMIIHNYKQCGFNKCIDYKFHFNSGIIYCKDNHLTRNFFNDWHSLWLISQKQKIIIDQPSFNYAHIKNAEIIKELNGEWNCQLIHGGARFLSTAKIIHYFSSVGKFRCPYSINNAKIFELVRETKGIATNLHKLLETPKSLFEEQTTLVVIPASVLYQAPVRELVRLYNKNSFIYTIYRYFFTLTEFLHR
jgi:hypothetical protein